MQEEGKKQGGFIENQNAEEKSTTAMATKKKTKERNVKKRNEEIVMAYEHQPMVECSTSKSHGQKYGQTDMLPQNIQQI